MTNDEEIRRANDAERLMAEPMLKEAFAKVEAAILAAMLKADLNAPARCVTLISTLQTVQGVKGHFREVMETGRLARIQKETLAEKVKSRFGR
jgi:hypothetical protein